MIKRCAWSEELPIYRDYHDNEWGKPQFDGSKRDCLGLRF